MISLSLHFKHLSIESQHAMTNAASNPFLGRGMAPEIKNSEEDVKKITGHKYAKMVNSGNSAIMVAINSIKGSLLLPDQGGWSGVKKIADILNTPTHYIPTEKGVIYPDLLEEYLTKVSFKPSALFITSFAGYTAEQPVKDLYDICYNHNILLVEDASGSVGDSKKKLCNGNHAHVILASTGSPKIVNVGNGGFISTNKKEILDKSAFLLKMLRADAVTCAGISEELKHAPRNLIKTINACNYLKNKIPNIIHKEKRGINVILPSSDPKTHSRILREKIKVDGRSIITTCPLYDRVMENAICIEIKNLDTSSLTQDNLSQIKEDVTTTLF